MKLLATALITIGALLTPIAVVANWAQLQLSSTDDFVSTFGSLAREPEVQEFVSQQAATVIVEQVDIPGITQDLFTGLADLGLPSRATAALSALQGAAVLGAQSLIERTVQDFVSSDAFDTVFEGTLRLTHTQLIAALQNDPDAALTIANGEIGIQLGPIIASVRQLLIDRGLTFASAIPAIDRTVVIAQSDSLALAQQAYGITLAVGTWLPWITLALLLAGVLVARPRRFALLLASASVAGLMVVTVIGLGVGRLVVADQLTVPESVANVIYDQLTRYTLTTAVAIAILALAVGVAAWFWPRLVRVAG
ncbi:hypothetical protein BH10ACT7_BH10ACT7_28830 [soil metagenome]